MQTSKIWGITETHLVYTTEEDAKTMAEWLTKKVPHLAKGFKVHEIFPDCFINKIKNGYDTWRVVMERDGTVKECKQVTGVLPGRFGFNKGSIQVISYNHSLPANTYTEHRAVVYTALARDREEAIALCEKYRIKTLIDDIWQGKKKEPF